MKEGLHPDGAALGTKVTKDQLGMLIYANSKHPIPITLTDVDDDFETSKLFTGDFPDRLLSSTEKINTLFSNFSKTFFAERKKEVPEENNLFEEENNKNAFDGAAFLLKIIDILQVISSKKLPENAKEEVINNIEKTFKETNTEKETNNFTEKETNNFTEKEKELVTNNKEVFHDKEKEINNFVEKEVDNTVEKTLVTNNKEVNTNNNFFTEKENNNNTVEKTVFQNNETNNIIYETEKEIHDIVEKDILQNKETVTNNFFTEKELEKVTENNYNVEKINTENKEIIKEKNVDSSLNKVNDFRDQLLDLIPEGFPALLIGNLKEMAEKQEAYNTSLLSQLRESNNKEEIKSEKSPENQSLLSKIFSPIEKIMSAADKNKAFNEKLEGKSYSEAKVLVEKEIERRNKPDTSLVKNETSSQNIIRPESVLLASILKSIQDVNIGSVFSSFLKSNISQPIEKEAESNIIQTEPHEVINNIIGEEQLGLISNDIADTYIEVMDQTKILEDINSKINTNGNYTPSINITEKRTETPIHTYIKENAKKETKSAEMFHERLEEKENNKEILLSQETSLKNLSETVSGQLLNVLTEIKDALLSTSSSEDHIGKQGLSNILQSFAGRQFANFGEVQDILDVATGAFNLLK